MFKGLSNGERIGLFLFPKDGQKLIIETAWKLIHKTIVLHLEFFKSGE